MQVLLWDAIAEPDGKDHHDALDHQEDATAEWTHEEVEDDHSLRHDYGLRKALYGTEVEGEMLDRPWKQEVGWVVVGKSKALIPASFSLANEEGAVQGNQEDKHEKSRKIHVY